jgi:chromosome partition protein MukE
MYIVDAAAHLERFYRRYGCELCERPDGYYYLVPLTDKIARRQLGTVEMLAGQALALLFLDPRTLAGDAPIAPVATAATESGDEGAAETGPREEPEATTRPGVVTQSALVAHLTSLLGRDALLRLLNPGRKRIDERLAEEQARSRIREGVRKLAALGFVQLLDEDGILLRPALLRFADPVRGTKDPAAALEQLVARGEVVITTPGAAEDAHDAPADEEENDADDEPLPPPESEPEPEPEPDPEPEPVPPPEPVPVPPPPPVPAREPEPGPTEIELGREPPEVELDREPPDFELDREPQDAASVGEKVAATLGAVHDDGEPEG